MFVNRMAPYSLKGERTAASGNRWQQDFAPGLISKDAECHAFQVGYSTIILWLDGNCGLDYDQ
jgi:hypothetical protein